jgi:hypothetical protein
MGQKQKKTFVDNQTIFNRLDDKRNLDIRMDKNLKKSISENLLRN